MTENEWYAEIAGMLRAEIKRRNLSYPEVSEKLKAIGVEKTPGAIASALHKGSFSAAFMVQVLTAIGCEALRIERP